MSAAATGPGRARRMFAWLHLWIGLILCVPLVMLGLTGSVLVFEHELAELLDPALHRATVGEPRPVGAIIAAARGAAPGELRPTFVMLPEAPGDSARVRFMPPGRSAPGLADRVVFIDPVTLDPLGARSSADGILRQIFVLHANLMIRDRSGRQAVGWLGVVMLALGLSGIVLWWPRGGRWAAAFTVKRGARGVRLHRDLHGAVGIWGLVVFIVVSFSGVYLVFPQQLGSAVSAIIPARELRATAQAVKATPVRGQPPIDVDSAVEIARAAVPDGRLRRVSLPQRPDQPYRVGFARQGERHGTPLAAVFVDPYAQRVLQVMDPKTYTAGETFMAWQHALHAGEGLGWTWKILVFLSGFLPLLFAITGVAMWWMKRRARRVAATTRTAPAE